MKIELTGARRWLLLLVKNDQTSFVRYLSFSDFTKVNLQSIFRCCVKVLNLEAKGDLSFGLMVALEELFLFSTQMVTESGVNILYP